MTEPRIDLSRAAMAVIAASAVGGVAVGLEVWAGGIFGYLAQGAIRADEIAWIAVGGLLLGGMGAVYAGVVFFMGLILIGVPVWLALHGLGVRRRRVAVLAGAVLAGAAGVVVLTVFNEGRFGLDMLALAAFLIPPGAVAGWILHRIAYDGWLETP